jgi:hypothetical protein
MTEDSLSPHITIVLHNARLCATEKRVNVILMAVVPTQLCGNNGKNRCPLWSKGWCMKRNIHSDINLQKFISTTDDHEKHLRMDNETLVHLMGGVFSVPLQVQVVFIILSTCNLHLSSII